MASSSNGSPCINGPSALISTSDDKGLEITYSIKGAASGSTFSWSVSSKLEISGSSSGDTVKVRTKANVSSTSSNDQSVQCVVTHNGNSETVTKLVTVLRPAYAAVSNGGSTSITTSKLTRVISYQLQHQFGGTLTETATYIDCVTGQPVTVTLANLLVSEQLTMLPPVPSNPPSEAHNVDVGSGGTFNDTHSHPRNIEVNIGQHIIVHQKAWNSQNGMGGGNVVRHLRIDSGDPVEDPDDIVVREWPNGAIIPEE